MMKREFVEVKTYRYDLKGRVTKKTKHVVEAVDDGEDTEMHIEEQPKQRNPIGFHYEPVEIENPEEDICEEDDE